VTPLAGRFGLFLAFWLMIAGYELGDLPVGLAAAALATWASRRLLPAGNTRVRLVPLAGIALHFFRQSVSAGAQVASLAFRPSMPIHPGFIAYSARLRPAGARNAFCALSSLLPGTLPAGTDEHGALAVHCLDVEQRVTDNLAEEEDLFLEMVRDD
jgi:multicomponent Na+:H+ antiporter subunit E